MSVFLPHSIRAFVRDLRGFSEQHGILGSKKDIPKNEIPLQWRYFFRWRNSLTNCSPILDRQPWMTYAAIDYLAEKIQTHYRIFEWGSGGSTLFFRNRAAMVITIEHAPGFFQSLSSELDSDGPSHQYSLIPGTNDDPLDHDYLSAREPGLSFKNYVHAIDSFEDSSFEIISVDGRSRNACLKLAIPKVKPGGVLILDNAERPEYSPGISAIPSSWQRESFAGCGPYNRYFWETILFIKPLND